MVQGDVLVGETVHSVAERQIGLEMGQDVAA